MIPAAGLPAGPAAPCPPRQRRAGFMPLTNQLRQLVRDANVAAIARASGVPRTKLQHWLAGRVALRLHEAEAVAAACGHSLRLTPSRLAS